MDVLVNPMQRVLQVPPGANLLEQLREHRVPMSYSCLAGRCGTCRCKVTAGDVLDAGQGLRRPVPGDSPFVLACQTFLTEPCTIEIPEPDEIVVHPPRGLKAKVTAIERVAHDVVRLQLGLARPLAYSPGQHVQLQFAPGLVRPYSMAGCGDGSALEFFIRLMPEGRASGHVAQALKLGDAVRVSGPLGTGYLRHQHQGPMLCVAGGTGLAPVLSVVRGAIDAGMRNPIHLYVGARRPRDLFGLDRLQELRSRHEQLHVNVVVASAGAQPHRSGLVTDAIEADLKDLGGWRAYLFGSPPLVEASTVLLRRLRLPPERIYADAFYTEGS